MQPSSYEAFTVAARKRVNMAASAYYKTIGWGLARPALLSTQELPSSYAHLMGSITSADANEIWGKVLVSATAHVEADAIHEILTRRNGTKITKRNRAKLRIEMNVRRGGRVVGRVSYTFKDTGRKLHHHWRDLGFLEPFNGSAIMAMEEGWKELGYEVKRHLPSDQMKAELAMAMISQLVAG